MCGIAGFFGVDVPLPTRFKLVTALGQAIDTRGGHSVGFAASDGSVMKAAGKWGQSSVRFRAQAASGPECILHARFATCGNAADPTQAHPFTVHGTERSITGVHNGVFWGARETAKANGRPYTVDSLEFYRLLADGDLSAIRTLSGYGALSYRDLGADGINLVRLTPGSDLVLYSLAEGGYVWASTARIAYAGAEAAGLHISGEYDVRPDGRPTQVRHDGVWHMSDDKPIRLASGGATYTDDADEWDYQRLMWPTMWEKGRER